MSTGFDAHGAQMKMGDGASPEVFTKIAQCRDIGGPSESVATIPLTNHDSGGRKEIIAGLYDGGTVDFDVVWNEDVSQTAVRTAFQAGTKKNFQLVSQDGETADFAAVITGMSKNNPYENGLVDCAISLEVDGLVTFST